jgi:hydrogenase-4 component B
MPGKLLLLAALCLVSGGVLGRRRPLLWLALTLAAAAAAAAGALPLLIGDCPVDWEWHSAFALGGEPIHLRLDGLSALFLVLVSVVGGAVAVYSREYWSDERHPSSAPSGRMWMSSLLVSMGFVLVVSNGLHFLIAWELFTVSAYFLITLDRERRAARSAGWLYLAASHGGAMFLLAFFAALAARTGNWDLGPMREQKELAPLFWLALVGFGVKGGVFPMHIWLPSAHANAPSHVSALMSGVAVNMGIYGIVRFGGWLPIPASAGWAVLGLGAAGALFGIAFAFLQSDLKRLLAYCTVENMGIILVGFGGALLGAMHGDSPWGRLAMAGALLHVWNHSLFKSLLFMGAGSVMHATGKREMSQLGGLWRSMPWTAGLFALGALAVSGLPPLNGFVSEWLVYFGLFDAAASRSSSSWALIPAAIALGLSGALALATFVKAGSTVFLGAARTKAAEEVHECGNLMLAPMMALGGACVLIGLAPVLFWRAVSRAVGAWNPGWAAVDAPAPLATLGMVHAALAVILCAAAAWLWRTVRENGMRREPTWGCGYSDPTARMQYTSGSFSAIVAGWLPGVRAPDGVLRRPRGPFPHRAMSMEHFPDAVLDRVVEPAAAVVLHLSAATRRLQHGRLQFYVVYLLCGLAVLAILVWIGVKQ